VGTPFVFNTYGDFVRLLRLALCPRLCPLDYLRGSLNCSSHFRIPNVPIPF